VRALDGPARPADLLVVGNRAARSLVVDDEAEIRLVEAHPQRHRRHEGLHLTPDQRVLERLALRGGQGCVVRAGVDAPRLQPAGDPRRVGDREAVDDAAAGELRELLGKPGEALGLVAEDDRVEAQALARQWAADDGDVTAELLGDVGDDPVVGGRGRRQDRHGGRELAEDPADPAVVGPEVVAPVGDAVGLVDDEEPDARADGGQDAGGEVIVGEALGRDQEDVDGVGRERLLDLGPLVLVAAVDRVGPEPQPGGHRDLVAHEREERADDERRAVALVAADPGGDPVDKALAPARALDDERAGAVASNRLDRLALPVAEGRAGAEHGLEVGLEARGDGGLHRRQGSHGGPASAAAPRRTSRHTSELIVHG
jgi:hypothetical protein